jgi:hypothetical protein
MNPRSFCRLAILPTAFLLLTPSLAVADDSAASIAAGGLVPRREIRIVMAKEVLRISDKKVIVDYDFRNNSDQDVTTEVAFPIPPYGFGFVDGPSPEEQSFKSFKLWVNGKPVQYESEATATLNGKDVTAFLKAKKIDISTFGHFIDHVDSKHQEVIDAQDFSRLPHADKDQLVKAGTFKLDRDLPEGQWTVHVQYHWTQTFPAHSTIHIRHEYLPVVGYSPLSVAMVASTLDSGEVKKQAQLKNNINDQLDHNILPYFCTEPAFLRTLLHDLISGNSMPPPKNLEETGEIEFGSSWVDFILTSANTWQRPIEDFTLIIERGRSEQGAKRLISFCSPANGKVEKLDADHFQVHLTNFVPTSELRIGFFDMPLSEPAQPMAVK